MSHETEFKKQGFLNTGASAPLVAQIQAELDRSIARTQYRRLAEHLKSLLEIGHGREIVPLIGRGTESNNLEALITWVTKHGADIKEFGFLQQLEILATELRRDLDTALERFKPY